MSLVCNSDIVDLVPHWMLITGMVGGVLICIHMLGKKIAFADQRMVALGCLSYERIVCTALTRLSDEEH